MAENAKSPSNGSDAIEAALESINRPKERKDYHWTRRTESVETKRGTRYGLASYEPVDGDTVNFVVEVSGDGHIECVKTAKGRNVILDKRSDFKTFVQAMRMHGEL